MKKRVSKIDVTCIKRSWRSARLQFIAKFIMIGGLIALFNGFGYNLADAQTASKPEVPSGALSELQSAIINQQSAVQNAEGELNGVREEANVGQKTTADVLASQVAYYETRMKLAVLQAKLKILNDYGYYSDLNSLDTREELAAEEGEIQALQDSLDKLLRETHDRLNVGKVTNTDLAQVKRVIAETKVKNDDLMEKLKTASSAKGVHEDERRFGSEWRDA